MSISIPAGNRENKKALPYTAKDFITFTDQLHETYACSYFYLYLDPSATGLAEEIKREAVTAITLY